ncbi:sulfotransferase [Glaciecola sp. 1036]|uniref:sulfotransferase n=1 Tax=Alteromonadaceae TaxID=72275 RepID=UPI003CFFDBCE
MKAVKSRSIELLKKAIVFPLRDSAISINQRLGAFENVLWLIGDGRSGTTWVSSILNSQGKARELFEPYHPLVLPEYCKDYRPYEYFEVLNSQDPLVNLYKEIFSGKFKHRRIDFDNRKLKYNGLLVKDIFSTTFAHAILPHFPNVKTLLLVRNPFSVVMSKAQKKHWFWPQELSIYLSNEALIGELNSQQIALIEQSSKENDFYNIQLIHWCVNYFLAFKHLPKTMYLTVHYENFVMAPQECLDNINRYVGDAFNFIPKIVDKAVLERPSRVMGKQKGFSNPMLTEEKAVEKLGKKRVLQMKAILEVFGLDDLYDAAGAPRND